MKVLGSMVSCVALLALAACDQADDGDELGEVESALYDPLNPPAPVATDDCSDPSHATDAWLSASSAHFVVHYLPGTPAERDITDILASRETAYDAIRTALGITAEPTITVHLSPNRVAAKQHVRSPGRAWPGEDRYEVIYTGDPDSAEVANPGAYVARVLEPYVDLANPLHLKVLSVGLAEYLDQSGRDLHAEYALQLIAGTEARVALAEFEPSDIAGGNRGRAGSLVKFLVDRYGMATFVDILKAAAVYETEACDQRHATYLCINTEDRLNAMLDGVLTAVTGESIAMIQPDWEVAVQGALDTVPLAIRTADRDAIKNLVALMDQAIITDDAALYRSTMDGFYCERGEERKLAIAQRAVNTFANASTMGARVYRTGLRTFSSARVVARRIEDRNVVSNVVLMIENFPGVGWRVTSGPDWR